MELLTSAQYFNLLESVFIGGGEWGYAWGMFFINFIYLGGGGGTGD